MAGSPTSNGRVTAVAATAAVAWAVALLPLAFVAPVYSGRSASSAGVVTRTTGTLVGVNGSWVVPIVALPGALSLLAWIELRRRRRRSAWAAIVVLGALSLVGAASFGLYVLPPAALLVVAAVSS